MDFVQIIAALVVLGPGLRGRTPEARREILLMALGL
jgi:hypothetical protein